MGIDGGPDHASDLPVEPVGVNRDSGDGICQLPTHPLPKTSSVVCFLVDFLGRARSSIFWIIGFVAIDLMVGCRSTGTKDLRSSAHSGASAIDPAAKDQGDSEESALGLDWDLIDQAVEPPTWTMMSGCLVEEYSIDIYCQDAWVRHDRSQREGRGDVQFDDAAALDLVRIWGPFDPVDEEREAKMEAEMEAEREAKRVAEIAAIAEFKEIIKQYGPIPKAIQ
ncbi:MAG: hypothetical protein ACR2RV_28635 [Verrucomicrobiales bacterium]